MTRRFTLPALLLLAWLATARADKVKAPAGANLELLLPESAFAEDVLDGYSPTLTIDGKDCSGVGTGLRRRLKVTPAKGKDSVTVVYTYWPHAYSRTTRTRVVKLAKGKLVKASLLKEDKATPDKIYAIAVPTPQEVVEEMCKLAKLAKDDVACDVGCGDGRLCITAVKKFGAKKAIGWDIDAGLIKRCKASAKKEKVGGKTTFEVKDAQTIEDFSQATVVFLYLGEDLSRALAPVLRKTLKPGARVVSHRFLLGDWRPDRTVEVKVKGETGREIPYTLHLWTIKKPEGAKKPNGR